jgi:hypothetical protein
MLLVLKRPVGLMLHVRQSTTSALHSWLKSTPALRLPAQKQIRRMQLLELRLKAMSPRPLQQLQHVLPSWLSARLLTLQL